MIKGILSVSLATEKLKSSRVDDSTEYLEPDSLKLFYM
jgi:hypothetical protein